jgi:hypothetical protein
MQLESLEPRVLLSADPLADLLSASAGELGDDSPAALYESLLEESWAPDGGTGAAGTGFTPERPMLVLPGIAGSFAEVGYEDDWFITRGIAPDKLRIDPEIAERLRAMGYLQ